MKKVLITGGAGFIGSHLGESLLEKGYFVICADNLLTGSLNNIKDLQKNKNFEFKQVDIVKDDLDVDEIDYIFHLASPASPMDFENLVEEIALVNSVGTTKMLELAKKTGAKILIASSSEVYGEAEKHPQEETYRGNVNTYGPRAAYDEGKRFSEALTYVYNKKYNVDACIVRIFNTYGPKMRKEDGRVVTAFVNQALSGKPITVFGDGSQTRSFCYVNDMVDGLISVMFSEKSSGEIFNVGNPDEYTMNQLAEKIKELTKSKSEIVYKDLPEDDPSKRQPDISKIKKVIGWEPTVLVDKGLKKTIEFYKSS